MIPYARQAISELDVQSVLDVLRSDWLTTGPKVAEFERAVAEFTGAAHAVAVNSGTAALHAMMHAIGVGPGDEVIVPTLTFAATASCVVMQQGRPVFADVDPATLLIDPQSAESLITPRTKAIIAVDYAGQPCDYEALQAVADRHGLALLADGCHALGAAHGTHRVGNLAAATAFSFHPVKPITTCEGGMVTTNDPELAAKMSRFRNHGIDVDARNRQTNGTWFYEIGELGFNYRLSDLQCALGLSQLSQLSQWTERRQAIAKAYDNALHDVPDVCPLDVRSGVSHAYHLYVVRWSGSGARQRDEAFRLLREGGVGVNVHYIPVHLHPFYRERFATCPGMCPVAEAAYEQILSLPIFPEMSEACVATVVDTVSNCASGTRTAA